MSRVTANRIFLKDGLVYMDFASAQSDQHLCYLLSGGLMVIYAMYCIGPNNDTCSNKHTLGAINVLKF